MMLAESFRDGEVEKGQAFVADAERPTVPIKPQPHSIRVKLAWLLCTVAILGFADKLYSGFIRGTRQFVPILGMVFNKPLR